MSRKPFVREVNTTSWYFKHSRYLNYMSREITCVFIGALALLMLWAVVRMSQGQAAYESFLASLQGPWSALGLVLVLAFSAHNAMSWFNVTPKAMPVQIGEKFLPGKLIIAAHYAAWLLATLVVLFFAEVL